MPPPNQPVIGYLGRILPTLSETFVVREIAALRRLGQEVRAFSLYPPDRTAAHPEAPGLAEEVEVLVRPTLPRFWLAHLIVLLRSPLRYFHCLWRYVLAAGEPGRRRLHCLAYFAAAPFAAIRLRRAGVTHLHAHFANASTTTAMMTSDLAGIPFSFMAHAYDIFVDDVLLAAKLSAAAFVATCSHFHVRYLQEHYPVRAAIFVVRYGVDPELFAPRQPSRRTPPLIFAVGRLVETKGFHTLVEACARLRAMSLAADCLIIGEGPERERLTHLIATLQLAERVTLFGKLPPAEVAARYSQASLLVMPSCVRNNDRDGIPNVLLEAMAMGIPVVSTRVSGIPELVRDNETGLLVEPDDPQALADAIARLLSDPLLAERLARAGRDLVLHEFNIYKSARRLQRLFAGERDFREEN